MVSQKQQILEYLTEVGSITQWEAIQKFRITRLAPIIGNLKDEGYNIDTEYFKKYNSDVEKYSRCAKYSLSIVEKKKELVNTKFF